MLLTPLVTHLLAGCAAFWAFVYCATVGVGFFTLSFFGMAAMVIAVYIAPPARDSDKITTLDRFLINFGRILGGKNRWLHIGGVMHFEAADVPTTEDAVECMKLLIPLYPRLGSLAIRMPLCEQSYFQTVPGGKLDWGYHVTTHSCSDEAAVRVKTNELINIALDGDKPLWRFDLISNTGSGKAAVLFRCDHCLADGLRLVKAAGGFVKFADGSPAENAVLKKMSNNKASTKNKRGTVELIKQFLADLPAALTPDKPKRGPETGTCLHAAGTMNDPAMNQATVTSTVSFTDVKAIRAACPAGTSINDVVLAAFCGAMQRYAEQVKQPLAPGTLMRAFCAVSMPDAPGRGKEDMYNDFIMASFELPVGHTTSAARLAAAKETMGKVKTSLVGPITTGLTYLLGRLGLDKMVSDTQLKVFPQHSFVYSNVPGFDQDVCLFTNKSKITGFEMYYPNVINQTVFLSYNDKLTFSLTSSPSMLQQPEALTEAFAAEIAQWKSEL